MTAYAIPTGLFGLDGGSMFGTVPKVLWEKAIPADEHNRIPMEARCLLVKSKHLNILVDTGNGRDFIAKYGEKLGGKFATMYNINDEGPNLEKSLQKYGVSFNDIHFVFLTHLHFDHAGGATCERNGKIVPTFPNAKYFLQKKNLDTALNPNIRERSSYFAANFQPLIESKQLVLLDENKILNGNDVGIVENSVQELIPEVEVFITHGHTQGQQHPLFKTDDAYIFYCADLIPTSHHVRLAWIMGYDLDPLKIIDEKREILKKASEQSWKLFFEHDPVCDLATVDTDHKDFKVAQRYNLA